MVNQFKRGCKYCGKKIRMVKDKEGKWMAYEVNEDVHHNCQQPYYEQPPNNKTRDKEMEPTPKPTKDFARKQWEEENKKIIKKYKEDVSEVLDKIPSEQQIIITELSKQTHLLNEILQVLTKDEVDEND